MHNLNDEHDDLDLIQAVAKQLHIKTSKELHDLREVLFPSILCAMVHAGAGKFLIFEDYFSKNLNVKNKYLKNKYFAATTKLEILRVKYGADMAMANYDGRTPLHVAASEGGS